MKSRAAPVQTLADDGQVFRIGHAAGGVLGNASKVAHRADGLADQTLWRAMRIAARLIHRAAGFANEGAGTHSNDGRPVIPPADRSRPHMSRDTIESCILRSGGGDGAWCC